MAMVDYGALLRITDKDGNVAFVNKNVGLFNEDNIPSWLCEYVYDGKGDSRLIKGNYFIYAGDPEFFLAFYKGGVAVVSGNKLIDYIWATPFNAETRIYDGYPTIHVERLHKECIWEKFETWGTWEEYVRERWVGATGKEKLSELTDGYKMYKHYRKYAKRIGRENKRGGRFKYRPYRFLATWDYKGNHYEVIYGYGIEPVEKVWDEIKHEGYGFQEDERALIDSWFAG